MKTIALEELRNFAEKTLTHVSMCEKDANTTANVLVTTDTFGIFSHGTNNLLGYILKIQAGGLDPRGIPTLEAEGPAWAVLNGNAAIGMVSSCKAMNLAIEKAEAAGIGYVGVANSCHFGAAGYYSNMAASRGMIGIAMSNADPNMSVPNGAGVAIGNNPFSYAVPTKDGKSIFLDIALSNVAALKVVMARDQGESVPSGWLIDKKGLPTNDPYGFPDESSLLPMAGHKGYGLAILVEILSSVLTGAGILSEVKSWNREHATKNNAGHAFIAIDIAKLMPMRLFEARLERMAEELRSSPKAENCDRIFMPGETEWQRREAALLRGKLEFPDGITANLDALSRRTGIEIHWL